MLMEELMTITANQQDLKSCCGQARRQHILSSFLNTSYISFPYRKKQNMVFPVIQQVSCYSKPQHYSGGERKNLFTDRDCGHNTNYYKQVVLSTAILF